MLRALLDAIHTEDNRIGGAALTLLTAAISDSATTIAVESTIGFGEVTSGSGDALVAIDDEYVYAAGRTGTSFTGCSRARQNTAARAHGARARVFDLAQNTSALDLVRRGLLVNTAEGDDLDVIGRNLGLHKCPGISDEQYRREIREVAYLAKQPMSALAAALESFFPGGYDLFERLVSRPYTVFARIDVPAGQSLRGRFFLNGGEPHVVAGGQVVTNYSIVGAPFAGRPAAGSLRVVSGAFLVDGQHFVLSDGVNPAVTFEFDDNGSVVQTPTLRAVNYAAGDGEATVRAAVIAAIAAAPSLAVTATADPSTPYGVLLANDVAGLAGNVAITSTVTGAQWSTAGMSGAQDAASVGVLRVVEQSPRSSRGDRASPDFFRPDLGGSYAGSTITLGAPPIDGTRVLVDYAAFEAHYLPPDPLFRNEGDFPPYFADNLLAARCILDLVRAAGVGVELSVRIFT